MHIPYINFQDPTSNHSWPYAKHNGRTHRQPICPLNYFEVRGIKNDLWFVCQKVFKAKLTIENEMNLYVFFHEIFFSLQVIFVVFLSLKKPLIITKMWSRRACLNTWKMLEINFDPTATYLGPMEYWVDVSPKIPEISLRHQDWK